MKAGAKMSECVNNAVSSEASRLPAELLHDFNNLLHVIGGYIQLTQENSNTPELRAFYLARAWKAVKDGSSMTARLAYKLNANFPAKEARGVCSQCSACIETGDDEWGES